MFGRQERLSCCMRQGIITIKSMKPIFATAIIMFFLACSSGTIIEFETYRKIRIKQIFSDMINRSEDDRIYSGQIKSLAGLREFEKKYAIDSNLSDIDFKDSMLIFGLTDDVSTRAFQFLHQKAIHRFTLDYAETGIMYKLAMPGPGKKISYLQIFVVDRIEGIPHINVKNTVYDGLSVAYDSNGKDNGKLGQEK